MRRLAALALWLRAVGAPNPYWNAGNCGAISGSGNVWSDTTLDIEQYRLGL